MRLRRSFISLIVVSLILAGLGMHRATAADAKSLVIGNAEDSSSLDPARGYEPGTEMIHKATYDTLVSFPPDNTSKIVPLLATEWKISADGLTYTFTLKKDVVFSSGNPMTADDVVFSFNRMKNVK